LSAFLLDPRRRRQLIRRRGQSGFTLIELMVVVVIIAVLASISVPLFVTRMRERRAQQTALQLAGLYREARMRALGRGAAVLVAYDGNDWQVKEGVEGDAASLARTGSTDCKSLPTSGCLTNGWAGDTARSIATFDPKAVSSEMSAVFKDGSNAVDLCFTPLGRTFIRTDGGSWSALTSVLSIDVSRKESSQVMSTRTVVVLPNGTARLGL
jgi:type II secretion system protein H